VVAVQIERRSDADETPEVQTDLVATVERLPIRARDVVRDVDPRARVQAIQRLAADGVGDAEAEVGHRALDEATVSRRGPRFELDRDAVANDTIADRRRRHRCGSRSRA